MHPNSVFILSDILGNVWCFLLTEKEFVARKRSHSPGREGITISAAKYSSEDCAVLVQYAIAIVEYTRLCGPLKTSLEKQHELKREIEENERMTQNKEEQVRERHVCFRL